MINTMTENPTSYIKHYINHEIEFESAKEIYEHFDNELKLRIRRKANDDSYKFKMYLQLNPELKRSPCINNETSKLHWILFDFV